MRTATTVSVSGARHGRADRTRVCGRARRWRFLVPMVAFVAIGPLLRPGIGYAQSVEPFAKACVTNQGYTSKLGVLYSQAGGKSLYIDFYFPASGKGPFPGVEMIHGGGYTGGNRHWLWEQSIYLAQHGYVAFDIDYRLAPQFPYPAAVTDSQAAVAFVRQHAAAYRIDPNRIGILGTSAGGGIGASAAAAGGGAWNQGSGVAAVVSWSGPMDLLRVLEEDPTNRQVQTRVPQYLGIPGGSSWNTPAGRAKAQQASPINQVGRGDPPMFLANSRQEFVPYDQAQAFADKLQQLGVPHEFFTPKAGHAVKYTCEAIQPSVDFLDRYLRNYQPGKSSPSPGPGQSTGGSTALGPTPASASGGSNFLPILIIAVGGALMVTLLIVHLVLARRRR